ncbi:AtpZ/AtpI family protein [Myxococcus xanthus]|uniref:ATP synthase subunit n=1 Tax=Myxococcus xanthus TaxID=34 RepID=A0A7Y4IDC4_MYXXA|nr:AtpZ/AtpI family protein [Myxococcus xanthus]NOJ77208.1 ATP synthase subunit [Myxococcus xanthus]NOJ87613.1 ATP synthase subunit [Myxococcus xanthus]
MAERLESARREEARKQARKDLSRYQRRTPGGDFWRALALIGSVGWPIVILSTGGALLGRQLDAWLGTGVKLTLLLLLVGTVVGCLMAFRAVRGSGT